MHALPQSVTCLGAQRPGGLRTLRAQTSIGYIELCVITAALPIALVVSQKQNSNFENLIKLNNVLIQYYLSSVFPSLIFSVVYCTYLDGQLGRASACGLAHHQSAQLQICSYKQFAKHFLEDYMVSYIYIYIYITFSSENWTVCDPYYGPEYRPTSTTT